MPQPSECHIWQPSTPGTTGFVFSCPGKSEEKAGHPCAGQTGVNLALGLEHLAQLAPHIFPYTSPLDYLLTNAWPEVEFNSQTNRTEAKLVEVARRENVERLYAQIADLQYIVACGIRAELAVRICVEYFGLESRVAYVSHTSTRALVKRNRGCTLAAEIAKWAQEVSRQLTQAKHTA